MKNSSKVNGHKQNMNRKEIQRTNPIFYGILLVTFIKRPPYCAMLI